LKLAFEGGARSAHLEVRPSNEAALRLYRSAGFEEVLRRPGYYREPAEDALVMACADLPRAVRLESN
jgi:ribosomal-protein-alanine N-acetyltransferase